MKYTILIQRTFPINSLSSFTYIDVEVKLENYPQTQTAVFTRNISHENAELDAEQLQMLHTIAEKCPVHKILHGNIEVNTNFIES